MKLTTAPRNKKLAKTDLFVVLVREGADLVIPGEIEIPALAKDSCSGKAREIRLTDATKGPAKRVLVVGIGNVELDTLARRFGVVALDRQEGGKIEPNQ